MRFGPWEIGLILAIVLVVFGVGKLPQVSSALGKGIHSFKKAQSGESEEGEKKEQLALASVKEPSDNKIEKS